MQHEWSAKVWRALDAELSEGDHQFVRGVHVVEGLGGTHFVTVCSGVRRDEMAAPVEEAIHTIVGNALPGRRRIVRIVWAEPT
ncbi:MAG: hypothetical protein ABSB68_14025 [Acidimicrobiales bacterium]